MYFEKRYEYTVDRNDSLFLTRYLLSIAERSPCIIDLEWTEGLGRLRIKIKTSKSIAHHLMMFKREFLQFLARVLIALTFERYGSAMDFIVREFVNQIDTFRAYGLLERVWGVAAEEGVYWGDWYCEGGLLGSCLKELGFLTQEYLGSSAQDVAGFFISYLKGVASQRPFWVEVLYSNWLLMPQLFWAKPKSLVGCHSSTLEYSTVLLVLMMLLQPLMLLKEGIFSLSGTGVQLLAVRLFACCDCVKQEGWQSLDGGLQSVSAGLQASSDLQLLVGVTALTCEKLSAGADSFTLSSVILMAFLLLASILPDSLRLFSFTMEVSVFLLVSVQSTNSLEIQLWLISELPR